MNFAPARFLIPRLGLANVDRNLLRSLAEHSDDADFWSSKSRDRADSAHCIFQYPAMMVPLVQRRLLKTVIDAQQGIQSLYDPFVGSGTSLVSGMHFGLSVFGNDINPLAILISRVRTARRVEFTIGAISQHVARCANADRKLAIETSMQNRDKWFKPEVLTELSRLRRAIRRCDDLWVRRFLWVTLAETVRLTSNDRTSTYKLHARSKEEIEKRNLSPIKVFQDLSIQNTDSFAEFRGKLRALNTVRNCRYQSPTHVAHADTREEMSELWSAVAPFDLLMTSPPYGDNHTTVTYGQHSYLPLNWIDLADIDDVVDVGALRTTQEIDRRSLGGRPLSDGVAELDLLAASPALRRFADSLPSKPADGRARLLRFYVDFQRSLGSIVDLMRLNSYMIWTVGNRNIASKQVPTDVILRELTEALGCHVVTTLSRKIHHKRMPARNASSATMKEEKILLIRKACGSA